jgi:predicted glutamine amidotransferase
MCGLVGAIGKQIDFDIIRDLFLATQPRGKEATGFWTSVTDTIKAPLGADEFLKDKKTTKQLARGVKESHILLGHCRYATHGKPEFNYNNHPIESENWIVVHNGIVSSLKDFDDYKYTSDTDTENIVAYIERYGLIKGLTKIPSGASIILKKKDEPDTIYVWRTSTGDMSLALDVTHETIYICSGDRYIKSSVSTKFSEPKRFNGLFDVMDRIIRLSEPKSRELWKITYKNSQLETTHMATVPVTTVAPATKPAAGDPIASVGWGKFRPGVLEGRKVAKKPVENPNAMNYIPANGSLNKSFIKGKANTQSLYMQGDIVQLTRNIGPLDAVYATDGNVVEEMEAGTQLKIKKLLKNDRLGVYDSVDRLYVIETDMIKTTSNPSCMGIMLGTNKDRCAECFFFDACELLFENINDNDVEKPSCIGTFEADDKDCMACEFIAYCINRTWNGDVIDAEYQELKELQENAP